jgi:hypothetical protein
MKKKIFEMKKNEVWRNKKRKNEKMKNKWKQKNDWKTKWKNEVTNEKPKEK